MPNVACGGDVGAKAGDNIEGVEARQAMGLKTSYTPIAAQIAEHDLGHVVYRD